MNENRIRSSLDLKELWISLFNENNINSDEVDNDYQAVLMLIETVLYRTKCMCMFLNFIVYVFCNCVPLPYVIS